MNALQAKQISIHDYLRRKGYDIIHQYPCDIQYIAKYRGERTGSLMVSRDGRAFHDWGSGAKGSIIDLAMTILGTNDVSAALRDIEVTMGSSYVPSPQASPIPYSSQTPKKETYRVGPLQSPGLLSYAASRGIPAEIITRMCGEVHIYASANQMEPYRYIGWQNRAGGYELRNNTSPAPWRKRCIGTKDITIFGEIDGSTCLVFEGFFDFLSAMAMGWIPADGRSAIVLNSVALVKRAIPLLQRALEVHLWLDDDEPGILATTIIILHVPSAVDCTGRRLLQGKQDLNDFFLSSAKAE